MNNAKPESKYPMPSSRITVSRSHAFVAYVDPEIRSTYGYGDTAEEAIQDCLICAESFLADQEWFQNMMDDMARDQGLDPEEDYDMILGMVEGRLIQAALQAIV
jgi:hypothetical protein